MDKSDFKKKEERKEIFPISLIRKNQKFLDDQSGIHPNKYENCKISVMEKLLL